MATFGRKLYFHGLATTKKTFKPAITSCASIKKGGVARAVPPCRPIMQAAWGLTSRRGPLLMSSASAQFSGQFLLLLLNWLWLLLLVEVVYLHSLYFNIFEASIWQEMQTYSPVNAYWTTYMHIYHLLYKKVTVLIIMINRTYICKVLCFQHIFFHSCRLGPQGPPCEHVIEWSC